jgi:hypothetical protein
MNTAVSSSLRRFSELFGKACKGDIAKARVAPLAVVKDFDVLLVNVRRDGAISCPA